MLTAALLPLMIVAVGTPGTGEDTAGDCRAERPRRATVEITLSKAWKDRVEEIKNSFRSGETVTVRVRFFPFLDPPTNIGIGRCVQADTARRAIQAAIAYNRGVDHLIRQDILPLDWVMIGTTQVAELAWVPITADERANLSDPALSTEEFQALYRKLATPKERKRPFGFDPVPIIPVPEPGGSPP